MTQRRNGVMKRAWTTLGSDRIYLRSTTGTTEPPNANAQPLPEYDILVDPSPDLSERLDLKDQPVEAPSSDPHSCLRTSSRDQTLQGNVLTMLCGYLLQNVNALYRMYDVQLYVVFFHF